jgi:hypothetical protein
MRHTSILLLVGLFSFLIFPQTKIEERVEINPTPMILLKPLAPHTIRVDLQWTPANIPTAILIYDDSSPYTCRITGGSNFETTGFISYEQQDVLGGSYALQFRSAGQCNQPNVISAQYFVYFDDSLITNGSFTIGGCFSNGSFPFYNVGFRTPLRTDYTFNIYPANLCRGKGTTPELVLGNGCTNVEIDPATDMIDLQILSGGTYASFNYQGMTTDNLTVPYAGLNNVDLIQDEFPANVTTVYVQSNISGIIKQDSVKVYPKSSYGLTASSVYPIYYGQTTGTEVRTYGPGGCEAIFPADIKLNATITKGNQLGYLRDYENGATGDTLSNIPFEIFGGNHIDFISDGDKKDIADTVIITLSTTDAEIGTKQVEIIIIPNPLYVAIEPEIVAPGDTAMLIIKNRLEDGTLIDFPEWQTFEVKMADGCTLGKILSDVDTAKYFYDIPQPIKFIADSLAESGTVSLIVGLVEDIIIGRPMIENETDKINKTVKEKSGKHKDGKTEKEVNENPSTNPGEEFCPADEIQSYTTEQLDFVVGDGWCEDLDECNDPTEFPEIDWEDHRNGYELTEEKTGKIITTDICVDEKGKRDFISSSGFIGSGFKEFMEYSEIELCFNSETNKIQFKYGDDNEITINWVWDFCPDYINSKGIIRARDIYSIPGTIQPFCYEVKHSLELQKIYPTQLGEGDYMFEDIWEMHEEGHRKLFEESLNKFKPFYLEEMRNLEKSCEEFASENDAKNFYSEKAKDLITKFYDAGINDENQQSNRLGDSKFPIVDLQSWRDLEDKVHKPVKGYIDDLIKLVKPSEIGCK